MSSATQKFTETYPKRSDVIGSCEQAFGCGTVFHTTIVNSIKAGTVAAIGIVAFGSLETQFMLEHSRTGTYGKYPYPDYPQ